MGNSIGNLPMLRIPPSGLGAVRSSLDPNDPDYLRKMGLIGSIEGAHELEQANQDIASQERARAQMDLGGEGTTTGPVTHALGMPANPEAPALAKPRTLLGKIGHGLNEVGQATASAAFPSIMGMIPGTNLYNLATKERAFQNQLAQEKAENPPEVAAIRAQGEETRAEEAQLAREQAAQTAEANKEKAAATTETNKQKDALQKQHAVLYNSLAEHGMQPTFADNGTLKSISPVPGYEDFEKALTAAKQGTAKNAGFMTMYAAYRFYQSALQENPNLLPVIAPMIQSALQNAGVTVGPEFSKILSQLPPNMPQNEFGQAIGTRMPGSPVAPGAINTSGLFAQRFLSEEPRIRQELQSNADLLGPVMGRAELQFLLGEVGTTGDPVKDRALQQLKTDFGMVASNVSRFHTASVREMEKLESLADANKLTPAALEGYLDTIHDWATSATEQGQGRAIIHKGGIPKGAVLGTLNGKRGYVLDRVFHATE